MDFRELTYVSAIAQHKSLTKAAHELFISQPTLTKFLQNLEKELGISLFQKISNKFVLTYAGERYLAHAREIVKIKHQLDQEMADIVKRDVGELRVGFPLMRGTYIIPLALPIFRQKYPNVKILLHEHTSSKLEVLLSNGIIDVAFFNLPINDPQIRYDVVKNEEVLLILPESHPLADKAKAIPDSKYPWLDLRDCADEAFVLQLPGQRTRQLADDIFHRLGIIPKILLETRSINAGVQLVASGYGAGIVTENHLRHILMPRKPRCFSIGEPRHLVGFVCAYRSETYLPHYTKDFIQIVRDVS